MLRLPRKTSRRCSKCCACHKKNDAAPKVINCRRSSADLYEGAPSAAPATQSEPEVLQVLRLPRKTSRRCSKCCACHKKTTRHRKSSIVDGLPRTSMKVLQVLGLPRKTSRRCSKCCACHTKRSSAQSHQSSPDFCGPL